MSIRVTGNTHYLSGTIANVSATVICWMRWDNVTGTKSPWSIDNNTLWAQPFLSGTTLSHGFAHGSADPTIATGIAANQWYFLASLLQLGTVCSCYFGKLGDVPHLVNDSTGVNMSGSMPSTTIILGNESALDQFHGGDLAGFLYYERVLSKSEVLRQAKRLSPVSRNGLRFYLPLLEKGAPEINRAGFGLNLTHTGSLAWGPLAPQIPRSARSAFLR